mgnify:CR=1 FL=1
MGRTAGRLQARCGDARPLGLELAVMDDAGDRDGRRRKRSDSDRSEPAGRVAALWLRSVRRFWHGDCGSHGGDRP